MTWILVAHRDGAALYEHTHGGDVRLLDRRQGVTSRGMASISSDPRARPASSDDIGNLNHSEEVRFTLELADLLEDGVHYRGVEALILMAEAKLLGSIRRHLSAATARRIHASLNLARPDWDEFSLARHLAPLLPPERSPGAPA